jgi:hypothetical protein
MPDTANAQSFLPRRPIASVDAHISPDNVVQWVSLTLSVSDPDSVTELLQKAEGRERDEFALIALRIGILAMKNARGQVDAEVVRREGDRLLSDLKAALNQSKSDIHSNLTTALKEYFDPSSGRFQERVERLIKQDGDLEQVLRRQVGNEGSELAKTLAAHIGDNSPLMRMLDPGESDGLVSSIRSVVSTVVTEEKRRILDEFSLDNDQGALKRLVAEVTQSNGSLRQDLADKIENVVQEFSLDKEDSALSRLVKRVEVAEEAITREFSLDEKDSALSRLSAVISGAKEAIDANLTLDSEGSALARLKRELVDILNGHQQKVQQFQSNIQATLEAMKMQRTESARSVQHGLDFEATACEFIQREAQKSGDITDRTGQTTGLIKSCKVGDIVVELGADCAAAGAKFVVEAKEDSSYTLAKACTEIETARKNRGASVGLFLFSAKTAPQGMDALVRQGEDVFVVWDADKLDSDVILRAGLLLAKALCVRLRKEQDAEEGNWSDLDSAILAIEKESGRLASMKTWTETIQTNSGKILDELRKMTTNLEKQIGILRESVAALKHE